MTTLKKLYESTKCYRELMFFDKIWTWEHCVFRGLAFCWQNRSIRAVIFHWKLEKKRHSIDFFGPYNVFLTEFTFFGQIMGFAVVGFHEKFEKNDIRAMYFWENGRFWQNMSMTTVWLLDNGRFVAKYGHKSSDF